MIDLTLRQRVFDAADQLFEASDKSKAPRVADVRNMVKCGNAEANDLLKEWRAERLQKGKAPALPVPEKILAVFLPALGQAWESAQQIANEALQALQAEYEVSMKDMEDLLREQSQACDYTEDQLASQIRIHQMTSEELDRTAGEVVHLEARCKELDELREAEAAKVGQLMQNALVMEEKLSALTAELKLSQSTVAALQQKGEDQRIELAKITERHTLLGQQFEEQRQQNKADQKSFTEERALLQAQLTQEQKRSAESGGRNSELVIQLTRLQEQLNDLLAVRLSPAERKGYTDALEGHAFAQNPYDQSKEPTLFLQWIKGYAEATLSGRSKGE